MFTLFSKLYEIYHCELNYYLRDDVAFTLSFSLGTSRRLKKAELYPLNSIGNRNDLTRQDAVVMLTVSLAFSTLSFICRLPE